MQKYTLNTKHLYSDAEINTYISVMLQYSGIGTYMERPDKDERGSTGHTYLLSGDEEGDGKYAEESESTRWWVAVTSAVNLLPEEIRENTPIDYFFDKRKQPAHPVADVLQNLLDNDRLKDLMVTDEDDPEQIRLALLYSIYAEKFPFEILEKVNQELSAILDETTETEIRTRINEINDERSSQHDVLDDILPLLQRSEHARVRVLFPYNISNIHWLLGEVQFIRNENNIVINYYAHDPYGAKGEDGVEYGHQLQKALQAIIETRLNTLDADIVVEHIPKTSPYDPRQNRGDTTSCGVIVAGDLIKRIKGRNLSMESPYSTGALALRTEQLKFIWDNLDGHDPRRAKFIENTCITAPTVTDAKTSTGTDKLLPYGKESSRRITSFNSNFYQGPYLKPGYRGTEYQIVTLLVKWLESLKNGKDSHALMEVANAGILDDVVIVDYDDTRKPETVTAFQVKYYEKPIRKSQLQKKSKKESGDEEDKKKSSKGSIGIDQLFIGYLALQNLYKGAKLTASLYTNTTLSDDVSTKENENGTLILNEPWAKDCQTTAEEHTTGLPDTLFSGHSFFADYLGKGHDSPLVKSRLDKLLAEQLRIGNVSGFPELIDEHNQITGDISKVTPEQWKKLEQYYCGSICRNNKKPHLRNSMFIKYIKSILTKKQAYNNNITAALSEYKAKTSDQQTQAAQAFLNQFRLDIGQATFEEQYNEGIKLLASVRRATAAHEDTTTEHITTEQKDEVIFAYIFNEVRLWFTKAYAHRKVPTLNQIWLNDKLDRINRDEKFWQEFGASNQLANFIYDKINDQLIMRKALQKAMVNALNSDAHMVVLHGEAGSGKSVLAKFYWKHWKSAKFFLDAQQSDIISRKNIIQGILEHLHSALIIIDRGERIGELDDWNAFFKVCQERNHQVLFVTREPDIIKAKLEVVTTIEVPGFTEDELEKLILPDFITKNPTLITLYHLPFFCRLAFDIDSREFREINRSNFVELAIEGVYSNEKIKKERCIVWQILCLEMLKQKKGHSAIEVPKRIAKLSAFDELVRREILLIESDTDPIQVIFMHDLFFEIGLESILTRSIETDLIDTNARAFSQRLGLCMTQLSQYNFSLLLPWLRQHQVELRHVYHDPNYFLPETSDTNKRLLLALLITEQQELFEAALPEPMVTDLSVLQIDSLFQDRKVPLISLSIYLKHNSAFQLCSKYHSSTIEETLASCFESLSHWDTPISETDLPLLDDFITWINDVSQKASIKKSIFIEGLKLLKIICPELVSLENLKRTRRTEWLDGIYPITFKEFMQSEVPDDVKFYYQKLDTRWADWLYEFDSFQQHQEDDNADSVDLDDFICQLMKVIEETTFTFKYLNENAITEILNESQPSILTNSNAEEITNFIDNAGLSETSLINLFGDLISTEYDMLSDDYELAFSHILSDPWNLSFDCALDTVDVDDEALKWLYDNGFADELRDYFVKKGQNDEFFPDEKDDRDMLMDDPEFVLLRSKNYIAENIGDILNELRRINADSCVDVIEAHFPEPSEDSDHGASYSLGHYSRGFFSDTDSQSSDDESEEGYDYSESNSSECSM